MYESAVDAYAIGVVILLMLAPISALAYLALLFIPLKILGIDIGSRLREITISEAIFFGLYAIGCGLVVAAVFSRIA